MPLHRKMLIMPWTEQPFKENEKNKHIQNQKQPIEFFEFS